MMYLQLISFFSKATCVLILRKKLFKEDINTEKIMNSSKTSTCVMVSATDVGKILPQYVVLRHCNYMTAGEQEERKSSSTTLARQVGLTRIV